MNMAFTEILRAILILTVGLQGPDVPGGPHPSLQWLSPAKPLIYAELDLVRARALVSGNPALQKALFAGLTPDQARHAAATKAGRFLKMPAQEVQAICAGVRRIGFCWLGFGEDDDQQRFVLIVERGAKDDVLPKVLKRLLEEGDKALTLEYLGRKIYGLGGREPEMWLTETEGRVAFAVDLFALQAFLLKSKVGAAAHREGAGMPACILRAEADGPSLLNNLMLLMDYDDRSEMAPLASFVDLPAWRRATLAVRSDHLVLRAELDPNSRLTGILPGPPAPPALLAAVPDGSQLAVIGGLRDPLKAWKFILECLNLMATMEGNEDGADEMLREFRRETGLDLETDVLSNLVAAGFVVPKLGGENDFERGITLLGQAKDAAKAETAIRILLARKGRDEEILPVVKDGVKVWTVRKFKIAIKGNIVAIGSARDDRSQIDTVLKQLAAGPSAMSADLRRRFPEATTFGVLDPSGLAGQKEAVPAVAGLWFADNALNVRVAFDPVKVATVVEAGIVERQRKRQRQRHLGGLHQIVYACRRYANDNDGRLPPNLESLKKYMGNRIPTCPISGKPYVYNQRLGELVLKDIQAQRRVVLAHAPVAQPDGAGVAYANGACRWLPKDRFLEAVESAKRPAEMNVAEP